MVLVVGLLSFVFIGIIFRTERKCCALCHPLSSVSYVGVWLAATVKEKKFEGQIWFLLLFYYFITHSIVFFLLPNNINLHV